MLTPEYFQNCKNLYVLFHYGLGGNHLGNLLSLHPKFAPRYTEHSTNHFAFLKRNYLHRITNNDSYFKVHISPYVNLDGLIDNEFKENLLANDKINILVGHWHGFDKNYRTGSFDGLTDHIWLIMSIPKRKTWLSNRLPSDKFKTTPGDIEKYASPWDFFKPEITEDNHIIVDTDEFVAETGVEYINGLLNTHLGITLPESAHELHQLWMRKLNQIEDSIK